LERLAQDNPGHRQSIVDIMCGYLRMPFTPPPQHSASPRNPASLRPRRPAWMRPQPAGTGLTTGNDRRQERQVRLTAQRILVAHLQPEPKGRRGKPSNPKYWPHIDLDLNGATLLDFRLSSGSHPEPCRLRNGNFINAHFIGSVWFVEATFTGAAWFREATFTENAWFTKATFTGPANFSEVTFTEFADFRKTTFTEVALFSEATFTGTTDFSEATFIGAADFSEATFIWDALFEKARAGTGPSMPTSTWPQGWTLENAVTAPQIQPTAHTSTWHPLVATEDEYNPQNQEVSEI
jgi:uncharacterized protein YjbI with pentapeptide repeats